MILGAALMTRIMLQNRAMLTDKVIEEEDP